MDHSAKTVKKLVSRYRNEILLPRLGDETVTQELSDGLDSILRDELLTVKKPARKFPEMDDRRYGDICFTDKHYWLEGDDLTISRGKSDTITAHVLRFLLDCEGETFTADEIRDNLRLKNTPLTAINAAQQNYLHYSRVYEPVREGRAPMIYGARLRKNIQEE